MIKIPLLDDVLKGLPDNARLRGQLGAYVQKLKELEAEVASDYGSLSIGMFEAILPEVQHPLHPEVVKLKLTDLSKAGYVRGDATTEYGEQAYRLCDKARRYLIEKGLLGPSRQ